MKTPDLYQSRWTGPERPASDIARTIEAKWHALGHHQVKAWVDYVDVRIKDPHTGLMTLGKREVIRSNLVRGLPPREAA